MSASLRMIPPGAAVGVLGSGQLGRMFAIAARRMGYRVHTFSPESDTPTGQVADLEVRADYDDLDAVRAFAAQVAVVTFEFENVPAAAVAAAAARAPVRPSGEVLHVCQQRLREKAFLRAAGLPVPDFVAVRVAATISRAGLVRVGAPAILKTAAFGYDGKGQAQVASLAEAEAAFAAVGGQECILEAFVPFEREVSVVAARGMRRRLRPLRGHRERPRAAHPRRERGARLRSRRASPRRRWRSRAPCWSALDVVGVLCVEMFVAPGGGFSSTSSRRGRTTRGT